MKAATVKQIKDALKTRSEAELVELTLQLSKFKKENKELLTYLLFEADDEESYIISIKEEMDAQFELVNRQTYYFIKKGVRKILSGVKRYIRYSKKVETEVALLTYFIEKMKAFQPSIHRSTMLENILDRQVTMVRKKILALHEDLQYDYGSELDRILGID